MSLVPFLWGYFSKVAKLRVVWQQETSQKPSTWAPALFKALFSVSSVYAPNTVSCLLSRLLSIFRETKPEATGRLCLLLPRKKYQLVLHSCVFTHCFKSTTAHSACVHQALIGKKPLGNTALYHWKGSEIQLWKQLSFLFSLQHHLYLFLTWQKASTGVTLLQSLSYRRKRSEIEMQPKQVNVALPNAASLLSHSLLLWHSWKVVFLAQLESESIVVSSSTLLGSHELRIS